MAQPKRQAKKKVRKNIQSGVAHITATFNNTIVSITDVSGNVVSWSSSGTCGFKGSRKSTPFAVQLAAEDAAKKAMEHGMRNIVVYVKGPGAGYSAVSISLVVFLYLVMYLWLIVTYHVPEGFVVFVTPVVILTHSLAEDVRQVIERLIYDKRTRSLRSSLRQLGRLAVEQADLDALLSRSLEAMCQPVRATQAVILVFNGEHAKSAGSYRWNVGGEQFLRKDFEADDVKHIELGSFPNPLLETTLLIPLYASLKQIGVLLLGRPTNGIRYSIEDLLFLQDPVARIAELLITNQRMYDYLDQIVQLPLQQSTPNTDLIPCTWVEDALQNIYDYAYLGDSPLVNLKQVGALLDGRSLTHLDKGKAVYQVVSASVEKLRPESALPAGPVPRAWYPYLILHEWSPLCGRSGVGCGPAWTVPSILAS